VHIDYYIGFIKVFIFKQTFILLDCVRIHFYPNSNFYEQFIVYVVIAYLKCDYTHIPDTFYFNM
jgi:hypothetical protein